jgi:cephalosporin-C deacetylase-like acetyl esterase
MFKTTKLMFLCIGIGSTMLQLNAEIKKYSVPVPRETPMIWNLKNLFQAPAYSPAPYYDEQKDSAIKPVFYDGLPYKGKPTKVYAWIGIPEKRNGKVPGIVLVHGGGGTAFKSWVKTWVERGYAAIAMDLDGMIPVRPEGKKRGWQKHADGGPELRGNFAAANLKPEDQFVYHAIADVILAHSLLLSLPEVDKNRTGITGISWGGIFTNIVAGLDNRFKFAAPVYGCGFLGEDSYWQETVFQKIGDDQVKRWLMLWDPSRYVGKARMPMLFCNGTNDKHFRPSSWQKTYRLPKTPVTLALRVRMRHAHAPVGDPKEITVFADSILKGGKPLPKITGQGQSKDEVWATYESMVPVVKAELNYTKDSGPWRKRKWNKAKATLDSGGKRVSAKLPAGVKACYLNIYDKRNCLVSTKHISL